MRPAFATELGRRRARGLETLGASNRVTQSMKKPRAATKARQPKSQLAKAGRGGTAREDEASRGELEDQGDEESTRDADEPSADEDEDAALFDETEGDPAAGLDADLVDLDAEDQKDAEDVDDEDEASQRRGAGLLRVSGDRASGDKLARFDPMQAYMREVQQHPLLTPDEEKALAVRYTETGDVDAAARLVTANLRLVVKIAYEYRRAYRNMMDLIQEGNMGLMQAVKKYDPYRGVKLSSYAAWWIRAYMLRYILANWRMVKLGTTQAQRKLFFNLSKEKARLSAMGIEPTNAEIARRLDVTEVEVEEMDKRMSKGDASLDLPVNEHDGRQIARVELLPASDTTPDLATESAELGVILRERLAEFRATLSDKDLIIFDERLVADEPRTLQDLGEEFGVSRERVRQLEARITGRLRTFLGQHLGDAVEITG